MIATPWPALTVLARHAGEIDPFDPGERHRFRGEEAFAADVTGWRRWSKPSPEPAVDEDFRRLLLAAIDRGGPALAAGVERLASQIVRADARPPLLVAILRAGVPVAHLLARALARHYGEPVPQVALSLFAGLGWDAPALETALRAHPGRPVWFVDGWTSKGGVARELAAAYARWLDAGHRDFAGPEGPRLAVLVDPNRLATATGLVADRLVPSACFTAPETLGFSRGFATSDGAMFQTYGFPPALLQPRLVQAWCALGDHGVPPAPEDRQAPPAEPPPPGWRLHVNEVVRALINRDPRALWLAADEAQAADTLAPVLHLARLREVPVRFGVPQVSAWGALAAARMA